MNFQIVYISPVLSREYGATVNNVAGVLFVLSDRGTKPIQATEAFIAERVCLSLRMVSKAKKILRDNGYITITNAGEGFKRSTVIECTEKMAQAFDFPVTHSVPDDNAQCAFSDTHSVRDTDSTVCVFDDTRNAQYASNERTVCVLRNAQCADRKQYIENNIKQYTCDEHAQCAIPTTHTVPTDFEIPEDFKDLFEIPLPEDNGETEVATDDLETVVTPEVIPEKKKRKSSAAAIPQSVEETEELVERYKSEHLSEPKMDHLDVHTYARQIFDWYTAKGDGVWRDKNGKQIKIPYRAVCNWINSDVKAGKLKTAFTARDFEKAQFRTTIDADARVVNDWENDQITFEG